MSLSSAHADGVHRIFNRHVAEGFAAYPEEPVSASFIDGLLKGTAGYPALAAVSDAGELLGFGFLRAYSPAGTMAHTAVTTIFLRPEATGRGIGSAILRRMLEEARASGITRVLAHVSSKNPRSIRFHARHGFVECGRFPGIGCKRGEPFDVVWLVKEL